MSQQARSPAPEAKAPVIPFRAEALRHVGQSREVADPLRLTPGWVRGTSALVVMLIASVATALVTVQVPQYAEGPAVMRHSLSRELTAPVSGRVDRIDVLPGDQVQRGQILLALSGAPERTQLARVEREYELRLVERLRDPNDPLSGATLVGLRAELAGLRARLESKLIRAHADGVVSDIRIRCGEFLSEGDPLLAIRPPQSRFTVLALLPGHHRPLLESGQRVDLELAGHRGSSATGRVTRVADQVIGPGEAKRFLGPGVADSVHLGGAVTLAWVDVDTSTFRTAATDLPLHDGMLATARIRVGRCRLFRLLLPGFSGPAGD